MCGIGGFCLTKADRERIDADHLAAVMLMGLESRGRHATGQAWRGRDGVLRATKAALPANVWVKRGEHRQPRAFTRILHTRYATQGDPANPANNHPIRQGSIIGTHNGTLDYGHDDDVFDLLGRDVPRHGQVDSEAIFALLAHGGMPVVDALSMLRGRIAVAWLDSRDRTPALHVARAHGSPLTVGQTARGSFLYASTTEILNEACADAGVKLAWQQELDEGSYLRVERGRIVSTEVFDVRPAKPRKRVNTRNGWVLGTGAAASRKAGKAKGGQRVAGWSKGADGVWRDSLVVPASEWMWDDVDATADAMAEAQWGGE